jgi:hypothetical protein
MISREPKGLSLIGPIRRHIHQTRDAEAARGFCSGLPRLAWRRLHAEDFILTPGRGDGEINENRSTKRKGFRGSKAPPTRAGRGHAANFFSAPAQGA